MAEFPTERKKGGERRLKMSVTGLTAKDLPKMRLVKGRSNKNYRMYMGMKKDHEILITKMKGGEHPYRWHVTFHGHYHSSGEAKTFENAKIFSTESVLS